jgi:hypothetical protein
MEERKNRQRALEGVPWLKHFVRTGYFGDATGEGTARCDSKIKREELTSSLFISFSFLQRTVDLL